MLFKVEWENFFYSASFRGKFFNISTFITFIGSEEPPYRIGYEFFILFNGLLDKYEYELENRIRMIGKIIVENKSDITETKRAL